MAVGAITAEEDQLLKQNLTHLNVLGKDRDEADFEAWYQVVRYKTVTVAPKTVKEASVLGFKKALNAPWVQVTICGRAEHPANLGPATCTAWLSNRHLSS